MQAHDSNLDRLVTATELFLLRYGYLSVKTTPDANVLLAERHDHVEHGGDLVEVLVTHAVMIDLVADGPVDYTDDLRAIFEKYPEVDSVCLALYMIVDPGDGTPGSGQALLRFSDKLAERDEFFSA